MGGLDLDIEVPRAAVDVVVLDAHVRKVDLFIEVRELVCTGHSRISSAVRSGWPS